jgi:hypothetical protein
MKIWGKQFGGKKVLVYCDNEASVKVLNSGFTKDEFMQCCLREICFIETRGKLYEKTDSLK